jgi:hypothetical protein
MDYNENKYWVEDSDLLTEAEKIQFAKDLLELERQGVLEYRDGLWLAADVEVEETPDGSVPASKKRTAMTRSANSERPDFEGGGGLGEQEGRDPEGRRRSIRTRAAGRGAPQGARRPHRLEIFQRSREDGGRSTETRRKRQMGSPRPALSVSTGTKLNLTGVKVATRSLE